jgi:hypothetical protein
MFVQGHQEVKEGAGVTINFVRHLATLAVLVLAALPLVSCGGESPSSPAPDQGIPGGADPDDVEVIDEWVSRLREGDVAGAAELFAVPSVAENGSLPIEIDDARDARLFNASLPCGAILVRAETRDEFTIATFRLTERPGPGTCGTGAGTAARTAFLIEDGLIIEWRRAIERGVASPQSAA